MWIIYLLVVIAVFVINYIIAKKFAEIAEMKGHTGSTYFWYTFIFGIVGMLMVVALPVKKEEVTRKNTNPSSLPPQKDIFAKMSADTPATTVKRCPHCGEIVKSGRCEMCGKEVK